MSSNGTPFRWLKRSLVQIIGRKRANEIVGPFHDWRARRRSKRFLAKLDPHDLRVNIGCGPNALPGWINLDAARADGIDVLWDLRHGLPFPSESCTAIFGEHVIEHITKEDAEKLLRDCHRVLQKGGVVRISTPDAGRFLRSYAGDGEFLRHPNFIEPVAAPLDRINTIMRAYGHLWLYDAETLTSLFQRAGFSDIIQQEFGCSRHLRMQGIDLAERAFESLYVEAVK
jgi:predicted SAM-dependent methyltransferase